MKKSLLALLVMSLVPLAGLHAEDVSAPSDAANTTPSETAAPAAALAPETPAVPAESVVASQPSAVPAVPTTTAAPVETLTDNLEFISGEISVMDEASKSVSVKLYGEDENATSDKTLKVTVDENTDITDGEQDRDLKSLTVGTEVDVEYDPTSSKATYIFVY